MILIDQSSDWETEDGWEQKVCEPVIQYPLAPREARAILQMAGALMGHSVSLDAILKAMADIYPPSADGRLTALIQMKMREGGNR